MRHTLSIIVSILLAAPNVLGASTPTAVDDSYTMSEDTVLIIDAPGLLANDTDPDGLTLRAVEMQVLTPAGADVWDLGEPDGRFRFRVPADWHGTAAFTYKANNYVFTSEAAMVTVEVLPVQDEPVAEDDEYSVEPEQTLTVDAPGILANDSDADGDTLTAHPIAGPGYGTLDLKPNGSFTYTPNSGYKGTDAFTYGVDDGNGNVKNATVLIHVNATPVAGDDQFSTDEDVPLEFSVADLQSNDTDADGDTLSVVGINDMTSRGQLEYDSAAGTFRYAPHPDVSGTDTFTYDLTDGTQTVTANVTLQINPLPPEVVAMSPTPGSRDVRVNEPIVVTFNDPMDTASFPSAFCVNGECDGTFAWSADLKQVTYTPRKQLERDTSYTVAINTDARDSSQTALAADAEYSFRTRQYGGGLTGESCGSSRGQRSPWVLLPLLVLLGWALRRRRRRAAATC